MALEVTTYQDGDKKVAQLFDGETLVMSFEWWDEHGVHEIPTPTDDDPNATVTIFDLRTLYADVLKALPQRLGSMGYGDDIDRIVKAVKDEFGKK